MGNRDERWCGRTVDLGIFFHEVSQFSREAAKEFFGIAIIKSGWSFRGLGKERSLTTFCSSYWAFCPNCSLRKSSSANHLGDKEWKFGESLSGLMIGKTGVTCESSKSYREGWFLQAAVSESTEGLRNCMTVAVF